MSVKIVIFVDVFLSFIFFFFFLLTPFSPWLKKNSKLHNPQFCLKKHTKNIQKSDPGAAPDFVKAFAESSTSIRVIWKPPPVGKQNGDIIYYKVFYVPSSVPSTREDAEATMVEIQDPNASEFVIDELKKWTEYRVWMLAGTIIGDGPSSYPVLVRTGEDGRFDIYFGSIWDILA